MSLSEQMIRNCIFGIKCEANWEKMTVVREVDEDELIGEVRFCGGCQKEVYDCINDQDLGENIALNRCVRIFDNSYLTRPLMGMIITKPD
jgi:hypothetical protein